LPRLALGQWERASPGAKPVASRTIARSSRVELGCVHRRVRWLALVNGARGRKSQSFAANTGSQWSNSFRNEYNLDTFRIHSDPPGPTRADRFRNARGAPNKARYGAGALSLQVTPSGRPAQQRGNSMSAHCGVHAPRRRQAPAPPSKHPNPNPPLTGLTTKSDSSRRSAFCA
jgi:hypothetical protein